MAYDTMVSSVETLTEAEKLDLISVIVASLKKDEQSKTGDCSDEYPKGFFDIFGSNPNYELKEPEELDWSLDAKRETF